jgi:hypothetical protein
MRMTTDTTFRILELMALRRKLYAFQTCKILYPKKKPAKIYPFIHQKLKKLAEEGWLVSFEDKNTKNVRRVMFCITIEGLGRVLEQATRLFSRTDSQIATELLKKYDHYFPRLTRVWSELFKNGLVSDHEAQTLMDSFHVQLVKYQEPWFIIARSKPYFQDMADWERSLASWTSDFQDDRIVELLGSDIEKYAQYLKSQTEFQDLIVKDAETVVEIRAKGLWDAERNLERINSVLGRKPMFESALSQRWNEQLSEATTKHLVY